MSREWYMFFLSLFQLTGSGQNDTSLTDLLVGPSASALLDEALAVATPVDVGDNTSELTARINTLERIIDTLPPIAGQAVSEWIEPRQELGTLAAQSITVGSGTYTPTLTTVANIAASSSFGAQYMQVGNTVTVSGRVDITPTAGAASTQWRMTLPVASNFGSAFNAGGCVNAGNVASVSGVVTADSTNDAALMYFVSTGTAALNMWYSYTYVVI